jgi:hypothetical protein
VQIIWAALALTVALHVILALLLFDPKPFVGGDNAGYMILAESLESGQGYRDLHIPGSPRHVTHPPGYPAVLAVARLFGGGLFTYKLLSVLFSTAAVVLLFALAWGRLGPEAGLAVTAPFALNPVLLYYSHWVLPDALFVALVLLVLWAGERAVKSKGWLVWAASLALLAYLNSTAGLVLVLALLIAIGRRRAWLRAAAVAACSAIVIGGWWVWRWVAASQAVPLYSRNLLLTDPFNPELGYVGPGAFLARIVNNVRVYSVGGLPESLAGVAPGGGVNLLALLAGLLLLALALVATVRGLREVRVLELFAVLYEALIIAYPEVCTDRRLLLPLLPALLILAGAGVAWCYDFLAARRPAWVLPAVGLLLVLLAVPDHVRRISFNGRCMRVYRQGDELSCYPPPWRAFVESGDWVRANTPEDAVVVSQDPRLYYLFSARHGYRFPFTADDGEMLAFFDAAQTDYVTVTAVSPATARFLVPVIRSRADRFSYAFSVGEGPAATYVLAYGEGAAEMPQQDEEP